MNLAEQKRVAWIEQHGVTVVAVVSGRALVTSIETGCVRLVWIVLETNVLRDWLGY